MENKDDSHLTDEESSIDEKEDSSENIENVNDVENEIKEVISDSTEASEPLISDNIKEIDVPQPIDVDASENIDENITSELDPPINNTADIMYVL